MGRWDDRICAIVLNWNGKKDTIECLESLSRCTYPKLVPIVVDNGSTDGSVEAIRQVFPATPIFEMEENLGFAGGNNVGIRWALGKTFDWIFLLNNDAVAAPDICEAFLKRARENPKAKILGAKILLYADRERIDHLGGMWNQEAADFRSLHSGELNRENMESEPVEYVCGAALFMHRSVPDTIGLLEERFFLFWEETDYCFRAKRKGFEVWTAPEAKVWHKVSSSFTGGKPHSHYFWWRSRLLWLERNLPYRERKEILSSAVYPDLRKSIRHLFLKSFQKCLLKICLRPVPEKLENKIRELKAGVFGALHYFLKKFGNCPSWIYLKK